MKKELKYMCKNEGCGLEFAMDYREHGVVCPKCRGDVFIEFAFKSSEDNIDASRKNNVTKFFKKNLSNIRCKKDAVLYKIRPERRQDTTEMILLYKCLNHNCRHGSSFRQVDDNVACPCCGGSDVYSDWYPCTRIDSGYRIPSWSDVRKAKGVDFVILACKKTNYELRKLW